MGNWVVCHQRCMGGSCDCRGPLRRVSVWLVVPMTNKPLILGLSAALLVSQWMLWDALSSANVLKAQRDAAVASLKDANLAAMDAQVVSGRWRAEQDAWKAVAKTNIETAMECLGYLQKARYKPANALSHCVGAETPDTYHCFISVRTSMPATCTDNVYEVTGVYGRRFKCTKDVWMEVK